MSTLRFPPPPPPLSRKGALTTAGDVEFDRLFDTAFDRASRGVENRTRGEKIP